VHGAFAESASWNGVIERLQAIPLDCVAVANPLRSLSGDAAYVRDVIAVSNPDVVAETIVAAVASATPHVPAAS
jgi:hypothetical protein